MFNSDDREGDKQEMMEDGSVALEHQSFELYRALYGKFIQIYG